MRVRGMNSLIFAGVSSFTVLMALTGCEYADELFLVKDDHFVPNNDWIRSSPSLDAMLEDAATDIQGHFASRNTSFTEFSYSSKLSVGDEFDRVAEELKRCNDLVVSSPTENQVRFELQNDSFRRKKYLTVTYREDTGRYVAVLEFEGTMTGGYVAGRPIGSSGSRGFHHKLE